MPTIVHISPSRVIRIIISMFEPTDARDGHLDQAEFKKKMLSQLQTTGVVGQVKASERKLPVVI